MYVSGREAPEFTPCVNPSSRKLVKDLAPLHERSGKVAEEKARKLAELSGAMERQKRENETFTPRINPSSALPKYRQPLSDITQKGRQEASKPAPPPTISNTPWSPPGAQRSRPVATQDRGADVNLVLKSVWKRHAKGSRPLSHAQLVAAVADLLKVDEAVGGQVAERLWKALEPVVKNTGGVPCEAFVSVMSTAYAKTHARDAPAAPAAAVPTRQRATSRPAATKAPVRQPCEPTEVKEAKECTFQPKIYSRTAQPRCSSAPRQPHVGTTSEDRELEKCTFAPSVLAAKHHHAPHHHLDPSNNAVGFEKAVQRMELGRAAYTAKFEENLRGGSSQRTPSGPGGPTVPKPFEFASDKRHRARVDAHPEASQSAAKKGPALKAVPQRPKTSATRSASASPPPPHPHMADVGATRDIDFAFFSPPTAPSARIPPHIATPRTHTYPSASSASPDPRHDAVPAGTAQRQSDDDVLLFVDVDLPDGRTTDRIEIRYADTPHGVATAFARRHGLGQATLDVLVTMLKEKMMAALDAAAAAGAGAGAGGGVPSPAPPLPSPSPPHAQERRILSPPPPPPPQATRLGDVPRNVYSGSPSPQRSEHTRTLWV